MTGDSKEPGDREAHRRILELREQTQNQNLPPAQRAEAALALGQLYTGLGELAVALQWIEYAARAFAAPGTPGYLTLAGQAHEFAADVAQQAGDLVARSEYLRRAAWAYRLAGNVGAATEAQRKADSPPGPIPPGDAWRVPVQAEYAEGSTEFSAFVKFNAYDRFDLVALNAINLAEVVQEAHSRSREDVHLVRSVAGSLLPRVRRETGQREEVLGLFRDLSVRWYLGTTTTSNRLEPLLWKRWAAEALVGLFYESRAPGGRSKPRLADRLLWASKGRSEPEEGLRRGIFGPAPFAAESETLKGASPEAVELLRVAQAILDDLADSPRTSTLLVSLRHLSDLAVTDPYREVNVALQSLLPRFDDGSFLFLEAGRQLGVGRVVLRWSNPRGPTGTTHYDLLVSGPDEPAAGLSEGVSTNAAMGPTWPELATWYDQARSQEEWIGILSSLQKGGDRLSRPPGLAATRRLAGYASLRETLVASPPATEIFERVCWKDQPRGLLILNQLLRNGSFSVDVDTDPQYLELELNELVYGSARPTTDDGVWKLGDGRIVRRERAPDGSLQYVCSSSSTAPAPPP